MKIDHEATDMDREELRRRRIARDLYLGKTYGISLQEYEEIWGHQGHKCAICGRKPKPGQRAYHVDHDHQSGVVRGILCYKCNRGLPWFGDSAETLFSAGTYLEFQPARVIVGRRMAPKVVKKKRKQKKGSKA